MHDMSALRERENLLRAHAYLAYHHMCLSHNLSCLEQNMDRMQLFARVGPPPGLSNERVQQPSEEELQASLDRCDSVVVDTSRNTAESASGSSSSSRTTLTIRNLNECTREMLMDFLDRQGFQGKYDLVYLPLYFRNKRAFAYAFVNFLTESLAREFQSCVDGCSDPTMFGNKCAEVRWSVCQGLQANIDQYRNSSINHPSVSEEFKPVLFEGMRIVPFPPPTKTVTAYRRKRKPKDAPKLCSEELV